VNTWILNLINLVMSTASGPLREQIVKSINEWEVKAQETKDPWDDVLVAGVKLLLNIK
jgi:hypothetical protein